MPDAVHAFIVRMPIALYRRLQALAQRERRTVSGQALYLLEKAINETEPEPPAKR